MKLAQLLAIIFLILLLSACDNKEPPEGFKCMSRGPYGHCLYYNCDKPSMAKFILKCAKAANPMSDEEGEDLVAQCEYTSYKLFCERV